MFNSHSGPDYSASFHRLRAFFIRIVTTLFYELWNLLIFSYRFQFSVIYLHWCYALARLFWYCVGKGCAALVLALSYLDSPLWTVLACVQAKAGSIGWSLRLSGSNHNVLCYRSFICGVRSCPYHSVWDTAFITWTRSVVGATSTYLWWWSLPWALPWT